MANTFRNDIYRPTKTLSFIVMGLFGTLVLCAVFKILFSVMMIALPDVQMDLDKGEQLHIGLALIGLVAILEILLRVATIVFFLIWEYRAFNNLSALQARNLEFSPGWAVGWWFIPFANLVKPFQVIRELWNESDSDFDEETGFLSTSPGTPEIVGFWWAAFLLFSISARIVDKLVDSNSGDPSAAFPVVLIVASLLQIAAAGLALVIVKNITQRQEKRFAKIGMAQEFAPPPPPTFDER